MRYRLLWLILLVGLLVGVGARGRRKKSSWSKARNNIKTAEKAAKKEERVRVDAKRSAGDACPVPQTGSTLDVLLEIAHSKWSGGAQEDRAAALACVHRATFLFEQSPRGWYLKGSMFQQTGKLEEASAAYGAAVRLHPSGPTYLHQFGGTLLMMGAHRASDALVHLKKAHALLPESAAIASDFALANYYTGQADEAIKTWRHCAEKLDKNGALQYYYNMVGVHQERSEWEEAKKLLTKMLKLNPHSSETFESLGVVQSTRSLYPAARQAFQKSLELLEGREHWSEVDRVRLLQSIADSYANEEHFALAIPPYMQAQALTEHLHANGEATEPFVKQLSSLSMLFYCSLKVSFFPSLCLCNVSYSVVASCLCDFAGGAKSAFSFPARSVAAVCGDACVCVCVCVCQVSTMSLHLPCYLARSVRGARTTNCAATLKTLGAPCRQKVRPAHLKRSARY